MTSQPRPPSKILGSILLARLAFVQSKGGNEVLERILSLLPQADQTVLRGNIWEAGLYPFALNEHLDAAIARTLSPSNPDSVFLEMGRASAETNLNGAHKVFLKPGDPQRFLAQAPFVYRFYYNVGRRTYEKVGPNAALLRTYEAESVTPTDCLTVVGWHERALELCGAKNVRVVESQCRARGGEFCEYRCEWA